MWKDCWTWLSTLVVCAYSLLGMLFRYSFRGCKARYDSFESCTWREGRLSFLAGGILVFYLEIWKYAARFVITCGFVFQSPVKATWVLGSTLKGKDEDQFAIVSSFSRIALTLLCSADSLFELPLTRRHARLMEREWKCYSKIIKWKSLFFHTDSI